MGSLPASSLQAAQGIVSCSKAGPTSFQTRSTSSTANASLVGDAPQLSNFVQRPDGPSHERRQLAGREHGCRRGDANVFQLEGQEGQEEQVLRIMDTDYAAETANLTKAQILQQAATSILAQANAQPQSVLALLQ